MKPHISIRFDENAHGVYYSGQVVSGQVEVTFSQTKKVRGILLDITGYASAHFTARSNSLARRRRRKAHYSAKEEYVSTKEYIYGSANATPTELQPGKYAYKFSCQLPSSVPSSFEGFYGHIRYVAKVVLDRPWKFDQKFMQGFTVLKAVDLNFESPTIRSAVALTSSKAVWGGIFKASTLNLKVALPQTGFVPGQQIPISVEIENDSNLPATKVRFFLRQLISYFADTPHVNSKIDIVCVARVKSIMPVAPKSTVRIEEKLTIPPVPPTSAQYSQVIRINYDVNVNVVAFGCKPKPSVCVPITIGTVPLVGIQEYQQPASTSPLHIVPLQPIASTSATSIEHYIDPAANIAPPSYEQAINMQTAQIDAEEENSIQRSEFIPRYPVYSSIPVVSENLPEIPEKEKYIPI